MRALLLMSLYFIYPNIECKLWKGYTINEATCSGYKIMYKSETWPVARDRCKEEGGSLAVPKTKEDFLFIQKMLREMKYANVTDTDYKLLAWLGINNLEDFRTWKTVDGKNFEDMEFHTWSNNNGEGFSNDKKEPHCAGIDAANPGLRDYWCHLKQPYICQIETSALH